MRMSCIHCGKDFFDYRRTIGRQRTLSALPGRNPAAQGLPGSGTEPATRKSSSPTHWLQNSLSGLLSLIFHIVLLLVLALISTGSSGGEGLGEDVLIGSTPLGQVG